MSVKKKKSDYKHIATQKRSQRRILTFCRICKYGIDGFVRNSWLSIAAIAVMVITLLIIFAAAVSHMVMTDTISSLSEKVNMSIYLKTDTTDDVGSDLVAKIEALSTVNSAEYISSADAMEQVAKENSDSSAVIAALKEATNKMPATIRITLEDINDTSELEKFVSEDTLVKKYLNADYKPSFAGERRNIIKNIGNTVGFAEKVGIVAASIFAVISSLIIFNTIGMAIFNRKEEIQMMQLIGADKSFIRGPFLVESMIYGFIAAIIATCLGVFILFKIAPILSGHQIEVQNSVNFVTDYFALVALVMVLIGAFIGIISSILATHRYLKL